MSGLEGMRLGPCRLLRRIGGGGMGDVYLAEQPALGRQVAVKVIRGEGGSVFNDEERARTAQRFTQEARAIASLDHPHILPLFDFGEQDGIHYLLMPYVPEGSLADLLSPAAANRLTLPLSPALTAAVITQAADALQYAHDRGVVHRDIKPHNLLIKRQQGPGGDSAHIYLTDFGVARFLTEASSHTGAVGTPLYSAPEQFRGAPVPATDQYALGCVAYLLLAGRPAFEGTFVELYHQHLTVMPAPVFRFNSLLPPAVDPVLARALAKEPEQRYPSIAEFAQALHAALAPALQTGWPRPAPVVASATFTPLAGPVPATGPESQTPPAALTPGSRPAAPPPATLPGAPGAVTPSRLASAVTPPAQPDGIPAPLPGLSSAGEQDGVPTVLPGALRRRVKSVWPAPGVARAADREARATPGASQPSARAGDGDGVPASVRRRWRVSSRAVGLGALCALVVLASAGGLAWTRAGGLLAFDVTPAPATPRVLPDHIATVDMVSPREGWALGDGQLLHYVNGAWLPQPPMPDDHLLALDMLSASEGWAVGNVILHYSHGKWQQQQVQGERSLSGLSGIAMVSNREGWAVGVAGIFHYHDGVWTREKPITVADEFPNLFNGAVWFFPIGSYYVTSSALVPDGVAISMAWPQSGWIVGITGTLLHYDGRQWRQVVKMFPTTCQEGSNYVSVPCDVPAAVTGANLTCVDMLTRDDGWAVGVYGRYDYGGFHAGESSLYHFTHGQWLAVATPTRPAPQPRGLSLVSATEGWAVGDGGVMLHLSGGTWHTAPAVTTVSLDSVAMLSATDGWAVGDGGTILHYTGGKWIVVHANPPAR